MTRPIITLTTDYGTDDHLVATMKGVILGIQPEAQIVDITHGVAPCDVLDGALAIGQAYRYFPRNTIHMIVVDPGVGTQRRPILASGDQHYFIAPDNGVLSLVFDREASLHVWHITADHYFLHPVSNTFHGRDIFAPVAGWLAKTGQAATFGDEIFDFTRFALPKPKVAENAAKGVVLRVDNFGNLLTNFTPEEFPKLVAANAKFRIAVGKGEATKLHHTFAQGAAGEPFAIVGSSGFLEIAVNKGSAARVLGASRGAEVTLEFS